jgi:transposase-like protein
LRNCLDYLPRKADDDCLQELRWLYARRNLTEAQHLAAWLTRWQHKYPKLTDWVEENIGSTLTFYRLPRRHHKHLKSTNMLKRLNEELRRRTRVVRIFPNAASCLRLIRTLCVETHESWFEDKRYAKCGPYSLCKVSTFVSLRVIRISPSWFHRRSSRPFGKGFWAHGPFLPSP